MIIFKKLRNAKNSGNMLACFAYSFPDRIPVLHIGAHIGQELQLYRLLGFENRIWFEPVPKFFSLLEANVAPDLALPFALWSKNGFLKMNIAADDVSSSIFDFSVLNPFPDMRMVDLIEIEARSLDSILENELSALRGNFILILDTQGSELECLMGISEKNFRRIAACIVETSKIPLYEGGASRNQIQKILESHNFRGVMSLSRKPTYHGDELFLADYFLKGRGWNTLKLFLLRLVSKYSLLRYFFQQSIRKLFFVD
jgi:FkbM family methyltransferase